MNILSIVLRLLGIGNGESKMNRVSGVVNAVVLLPVITYLVANHDKRINFETSLGFLALALGVVYALLEMNRRSRPGYSQGDYHD